MFNFLPPAQNSTFIWTLSCCLDSKCRPAASVDPDMCVAFLVDVKICFSICVSWSWDVFLSDITSRNLVTRAASCADHAPSSVLRTNISSLLPFVRPLCLYCLIGRVISLLLSLTSLKPFSLKNAPTEAVVVLTHFIRQGLIQVQHNKLFYSYFSSYLSFFALLSQKMNFPHPSI